MQCFIKFNYIYIVHCLFVPILFIICLTFILSFSDIHINYNVLTKEITCAGLKISNVVTCPIILSEQFDNIKIENESFIQFNNSTSRVIIIC